MTTMAGDISAVSLSLARRLSPSLILQPELTKRFFHRAESGALASVIQACPQGGKTTFLKQLLHHLEDKNKASKAYDSILWINIQTSISAEKFTSTLAALVGSKNKPSDAFELLENSNAIVFVDNFDLIENHQSLLDALKNVASKLRLIASVTRLPDISSDLAFEVLTDSYEGLSKTDVLSLVQKFNPAADNTFSEHAWTMTHGNPYLLRALLTAPHFESALEDYWTKALSQIHAKTLTQIQKAALTEIASHRSEAFFLTPLNVAERKLLRQLGLITEGSLPSDLRLHDHARVWLRRTANNALRNDIISDLKDQTQNLTLQEELAWQYQKTDDLIQSALVCETLLPRLHDQYKFKTVAALTEACWQYLTPITWNWRRLSIVNSSQSLAEVNTIIQTLSPQDPHLPTWHGLRLFTISRLEDWSLLERMYQEHKDKASKTTEGLVWSKTALSYKQTISDLNLTEASRLAEETLELARREKLHPRIVMDVLMALITIAAEKGNNRKVLKYINSVIQISATHGLHLESPVTFMLLIDMTMYLGEFSRAQQIAGDLPRYEDKDLFDINRLQLNYIKIHGLIAEGKLLQADQMCRIVLPDHMISKITPIVFRVYESLLQSRITVGASLEVQDVLRAFLNSGVPTETTSYVLAETLLSVLKAIDNDETVLDQIVRAKSRLVPVDFYKVLQATFEYEWIEQKIVTNPDTITPIIESIDQTEWIYPSYQFQLFQFLFQIEKGLPVNRAKLQNVRDFFVDRNLPLAALRSEVAMAFDMITNGDFEAADQITNSALQKYQSVESLEDINWLRLARAVVKKAKGNHADCSRYLNSIDLMSGVTKSRWYKIASGQSLAPKTSHPMPSSVGPARRFFLSSAELKVTREGGEPLIQDRPILVKLLKALIQAFPQTLTKEEICEKVWNEAYNPLVHDTRVYTSIRRLRDILKPELNKNDPIIVVDGSYRATRELNDVIAVD